MKKKILVVEDQSIDAIYLQSLLIKAGYRVTSIARSVAIALDSIEKERPDLVLLDIFLQGNLTGIDLAKMLRQKGIGFIYLSANSNQSTLDEAKVTKPYGFMVKPFREKDLLVMLDIAWYLHAENLSIRESEENTVKQKLKAIAKASSSVQDTMYKIAKALSPFLPLDLLLFYTKKPHLSEVSLFCFNRTVYNGFQRIDKENLLQILGVDKNQWAKYEQELENSEKQRQFNSSDFIANEKKSLQNLLAERFDMQSGFRFCFDDPFAGVYVLSKRDDAFTTAHLELMQQIEPEIIALLHPELSSSIPTPQTDFSSKLAVDEAKPAHEKMVGTSAAFLAVKEQLATIACTETTVLLLGESGTGKERVARYIHHSSKRSAQPMVIVNCAALPPSLIESELFGHEKGSFTGAVEKRIGKFEQAAGGTIFLDEIGEMPKDMQVKLLRVLQEKEFDRIGGSEPIATNVRVLAATNRNLEKEVAEGRFRLDLYYRLNVFPITLPPLRERKEDIPELAAHFLQQFAKRTAIQPKQFSPEAIAQMQQYNWPGNIRELENIVERTALLTSGDVIEKVQLPPTKFEYKEDETLHNEREQILAAIKKCNGKISGAGGAAEFLKIPATTLHSRMKKLNIKTVFH